jgi:predicted ATPase
MRCPRCALGLVCLLEAGHRDALALAHRLGAKLIELRAAVSLGRLLQSQGRSADARELLAPLYAAFTEGVDARDLRDARALLEERGRAGGVPP